MDKDTQITFAVIGVLVVFLGGLAYILRANVIVPASEIKTEKVTQKTKTSTFGTTTTKVTSTDAQATTTTTKATTTMETPEKITSAIITTNQGAIEFSFVNNTPNTVKNFAKLAVSGFYSGVRFHRVIKDFMIQAGDPQSKDIAKKNVWGTGGPGYAFDDEIAPGTTYPQGTVAMANSGKNTNGSQFFVMTGENVALPPNYTVFGHVTSGMDTVLKIGNTSTDGADRPLADMLIEKVEIK
jgi:cyclophilin family peptidyl-prolyl cis-trans isomerase